MSASVCTCRFCGDDYTPQGIRNHEMYCDENPHPGVPPAKQDEFGVTEAGDDGDATDPDQRVEDSPADLPPRETLSSGKKDDGDPRECENCGSTDLVPAEKARSQYMREVPNNQSDELLLCFSSAEVYCNDCYGLDGENYERVVTIPELFGRDGGAA